MAKPIQNDVRNSTSHARQPCHSRTALRFIASPSLLVLEAEHLGQLAAVVHAHEDVGAPDELPVHKHLRDSRPLGEALDALPQLRVRQDVGGSILDAVRVQDAARHVGEAAHGGIRRPFHENEHPVVLDVLLNRLSCWARVRLVLRLEVVVRVVCHPAPAQSLQCSALLQRPRTTRRHRRGPPHGRQHRGQRASPKKCTSQRLQAATRQGRSRYKDRLTPQERK